MTCLVLRSPDGAGGWVNQAGFTTEQVAASVGGVSCIVGWIDEISPFRSQIDVSQAKGNVAQGTAFFFRLIDHDGSMRRSVAMLDGTTRYIGWCVDVYQSLDGSSYTQVGGSHEFVVTKAEADGECIAFDCVSAWSINGATVGAGDGDTRVGLVIGGHQATIQTPAIPDPVVIEYNALSGYSEETVFWEDVAVSVGDPADRVTEKASAMMGYSGTKLFFASSDPTGDWIRIETLRLNSRLIVTGPELSEIPSAVEFSGTNILVTVSQDFKDSNSDATQVKLYETDGISVPIVLGASQVIGWNDSGKTLLPSGAQSVSSSGLLTFTPKELTANGFRAYSLIPCKIAFNTIQTVLPSGAPGGATNGIAGDAANINTDGTAMPSFATYDGTTLKPNSGSDVWTVYGHALSGGGYACWIPFRLSVDDAADKRFDSYFVDSQARLVCRSSAPAWVQAPFNSQLPYTTTSGTGSNETVQIVATGTAPTKPRKFSTLKTAQITGDFRLDVPDSYMNFQLVAVRLYGITTLSIGSTQAIVTPGASPYWATPRNPYQAAQNLLSAIGCTTTPIQMGYLPSADDFGGYFAPDVTVLDTAIQTAKDHWLVIPPATSASNDGTGLGELVEAPTFAMGAMEDCVTEVTIKYAPNGSGYDKTAYIAHVDEVFDYTNPGRYFGGWDTDDTTNQGFDLWMACRNAWKMHGRKRSETMDAPTVYDATTLGRMWLASHNGAPRICWLAYPPRFLTFKIRETVPQWWAGNQVVVPQTMASFAGYNLSAFVGQSLVVVSKEWDPLTLETTYEVILPPVVSDGVSNVIQQTLVGTDALIQQTLSGSDNLIQQITEA